MIIVDIKVPALDTVYNFSLSKDAEIGLLIEEVTEMICRQEKLGEALGESDLTLCSVTNGMLLDRSRTLSDYGIDSGAQLMLV